MRVSGNGGTPELVIPTEAPEQVYGPQMLPGGEWVLFTLTSGTAATRWDEAQIVVQSLESGERKLLWEGGSDARYVPTGHLVYALEGVLFALPFDLASLEVSGGPVPMVEGVRRAAGQTASANYGFSDRGTLIYIPGSVVGAYGATNRTLGFADRNGGVELLDVRPAPYLNPRLSTDGHITVETLPGDGPSVVWIFDPTDDRAIRPLTHEGNNGRPIWTPDAERVTFSSDRGGTWSIYWQLADGSGVTEPLTTAEEGTEHWPTSWSPDGRTLAFTIARSSGNYSEAGIWTLSLDGPGEPEPFYDVPNSPEDGGLFSPDGKWLTYWSREAGGRNEVWVQPFPPTGAKYQLTQDGGTYPLWSPDARHIFYRRPFPTAVQGQGGQGGLMEIEVETGPPFEFGNERTLPIEDFLIFSFHRDYDITPDGERFLMVFPTDPAGAGTETSAEQINIVLNWFEELKERVPVP